MSSFTSFLPNITLPNLNTLFDNVRATAQNAADTVQKGVMTFADSASKLVQDSSAFKDALKTLSGAVDLAAWSAFSTQGWVKVKDAANNFSSVISATRCIPSINYLVSQVELMQDWAQSPLKVVSKVLFTVSDIGSALEWVHSLGVTGVLSKLVEGYSGLRVFGMSVPLKLVPITTAFTLAGIIGSIVDNSIALIQGREGLIPEVAALSILGDIADSVGTVALLAIESAMAISWTNYLVGLVAITAVVAGASSVIRFLLEQQGKVSTPPAAPVPVLV